jgi:integrase
LTLADTLPTLGGMKKPRKRKKPETFSVGNVVVPIYRRQRATVNGEKRTVFEVSDYTTGARRLRGFTDHAAALKEAERIASLISSGQVEAASMRNSEAASYGRAIELLRPTGVSLEVAAATYAKAFEILGGDSLIEAATFYARHGAAHVTRKGVADVVVELIASKMARGKSGRYIEDLRARLSRFAKAFGADSGVITSPEWKDADGTDTRNRGVDVSTITGPEVQAWLDRLDVSPQTAKNFRTVLGTLFAFAESRGYVFKGGNPVEDTQNISANGGTIEIFTPEEIALLLKAASKDFLPVVAIGAFGGLRASEVERLEWKNVDLAGGFIHVGTSISKTRSRRLVPIVPNLAAWLAPYAKRKGKVWKGTGNELRDTRAETVTTAETPWKDNGLRHSFISYRLADIQNAAQVALEAGNSPNVVFKHYRELVKPDAAKAWFSVAPAAPTNVLSMKRESHP